MRITRKSWTAGGSFVRCVFCGRLERPEPHAGRGALPADQPVQQPTENRAGGGQRAHRDSDRRRQTDRPGDCSPARRQGEKRRSVRVLGDEEHGNALPGEIEFRSVPRNKLHAKCVMIDGATALGAAAARRAASGRGTAWRVSYRSQRALRRKRYCHAVCGVSSPQPESPCLPPARPLAQPSIDVAGPNVPGSIAACRRTWPPGSNAPAIAARAYPIQLMSNASSGGISHAGFWSMARSGVVCCAR